MVGMLRSLLVASCLLVTLILMGCDTPKAVGEKPFGDIPVPVSANEIDGTWKLVGAPPSDTPPPFTLKVLDGAAGKLEVIDNKGTHTQAYFRTAANLPEGWTFLNLQVSASPERYFLARVGTGRDMIVVWLPDVRKFESLIVDQKLKAEPDSVTDCGLLKDVTPEALGLLAESDGQSRYLWSMPLVFVREHSAVAPEASKTPSPTPAGT